MDSNLNSPEKPDKYRCPHYKFLSLSLTASLLLFLLDCSNLLWHTLSLAYLLKIKIERNEAGIYYRLRLTSEA